MAATRGHKHADIMKHILIAIFVFCSPGTLTAQTHNLHADVGISFNGAGCSVTYNYKLSKNFGVGLGGQFYRFPTPSGIVKGAPAAFADMRIYIRPEKSNQFFTFADLGMHIYDQADKRFSSDSSSYYDYHNNGFYMGFGFGYLRRVTKRGGGPYASFKIMTNIGKIGGYDYPRQREIGLLDVNATLALSIGFRF
jgi:hypothetical protein